MSADLSPLLPRHRWRRGLGVFVSTIAAMALFAGGVSAQTPNTPPGPNDTVPAVGATSTTAPSAPPATEPPPPASVPDSATTIPPETVPPEVTVAPATLPPVAIPTPPVTPKPKPAVSGTRIEVDISSQTMRVFKGGKLYRSVKVSTGSGRRYCEKGVCGVAVTPRGRFTIYRRISGWRTSRLGQLYNPLYFRGGFAIHGSGSVPSYPASHGCVRVTMATARWLPGAVPNGTPMWVRE